MNKTPIAMELRGISNLCMRYMDNKSHKKDIDSITGTNGWIIGYINSMNGKDVFQRDLEKNFNITRSTASKVVNLMVEKGLIERCSVAHDARLKKLRLTEKAKKITTLMHEDNEKLTDILTEGISEEELAAFSACLNKMKENLKKNL